jgi:hypothetical protein
MSDLMYRDRSGWIGVIMERFEDQRNPGAAGKRTVESGAVEPNFRPKLYRTKLGEAVQRVMKVSEAILHDH